MIKIKSWNSDVAMYSLNKLVLFFIVAAGKQNVAWFMPSALSSCKIWIQIWKYTYTYTYTYICAFNVAMSHTKHSLHLSTKEKYYTYHVTTNYDDLATVFMYNAKVLLLTLTC